MKKTRRNNKKLKRFILIILIIFLVFIFCFFLYNIYDSIDIKESNYQTTKLKSTEVAQTVENATKESKTVSENMEETIKSVVGISKLKNAGTSILNQSNEEDLGLGTGVVVTQNGYILSNEHVTGSKYSSCYITLEDGQNYDGNVVWSDSDLDLSIVKIKAENLSTITLGDSSQIKIGETVYAIGNPIGVEFRRTVTSGIISAKNRSIKIEEDGKTSYMSNLIQTDATINPGNSGGPLVYADGSMIGINTVKISSAEGIGFAVPINVVKTVIDSYEKTGNFEEASIGIYAYDWTATQYLTNNSTNFEKGIYVDSIVEGGAASNTELKQADIITNVDGKEIKTMNDLKEYVYTKKPGEEIVLKIKRGKIVKEIKITLGKLQ